MMMRCVGTCRCYQLLLAVVLRTVGLIDIGLRLYAAVLAARALTQRVYTVRMLGGWVVAMTDVR